MTVIAHSKHLQFFFFPKMSLDSEDDLRSGCWNVGHHQQSSPDSFHSDDQIPCKYIVFFLYHVEVNKTVSISEIKS